MAKKEKKRETAPRIAAIYARYSSSAQNDASIEQQVAECMQYAQEKRLAVVATFEDRAISGRSDRRPGFQKMLRAADRHEFDVLLAYKSNRISRNMQSALTYEQRLSDAGVKVIYCKEEFGDNATGRFMLRMMMNMNQFYSENMAEDIRRGMKDSATKGKVVGSIPYGYRKGAGGAFEIDEPAAEVVREIYARYIAGESLADIRRDLNDRGLRTKYKKPWSKNSFHTILTNEKYTGSFSYSGEVRVENRIPAIITEDVYAMAQKKMEGEHAARRRNRGNGDYLLTGKLYCGHCLAPMTGMSGRSHTGREHFYYACQTRRTKRTCQKENVKKDTIETEVVRAVQTAVLDDETTIWIANAIVEAADRFKAESALADYEAELKDVKKQIANVIRAIEMGVAGDEVKERMDELQSQKQDLQRLIAVEKATTRDYDRAEIIGYIEDLRCHDPTDPDFQKTIIDDFVQAVYLYDDHFKLITDFTGKQKTLTVPAAKVRVETGEGYHNSIGRTLADGNRIDFDGHTFTITWRFSR